MATYTPIQSVVLSTTATQVLFSNIPQDYTDIVIRSSYKSTADDLPFIRFASNGAIDAGTNYGYRYLRGNGSTAAGGGASGANQIYVGYSNTGQSNFHIHINGYSNTTLNKVTLSKGDDATNNGTYVYVGEWRNTGAITHVSVNIGNSGASFQAGSTFDLYGIKAGSPKAVGGNIVTTDGTYWYHAFTTTGTFDFQQGSSLSVDYLVVAGGGGTNGDRQGGGGAGGYRTSIGGSPLTITPGSYSVIVGAGGSANSVGSTNAAKGNDSIFSTITSTGGGNGGTSQTVVAGSGGSGGGTFGLTAYKGLGNTPSTSPSQGNNGGFGTYPPDNYGGGGGGGAGGVGGNSTSPNGGAGGIGSNSASSLATATGTGVSGYYAGGGGGGGYPGGGSGGSGGSGGGGNGGAYATAASNGTANTGGGGGDSGGNYPLGTNGGSGIVIVRYAV